jgi:protein SCO1/2
MKPVRTLSLLVLTGIAGVVAGALVARMLAQKPVALQGGTWLPQPRTLAPFQLTDLHGKPFGNAQLLGHPSLLFLGYSYCPDTCPTTLATLRDVQAQRPLPGLQVLFITVDPERDTPATLRQYLGTFSGEFSGLYANRDALAPLVRSLGAVAMRNDSTGAGYVIDHSATLYLLDTRGRLAAVFTPPLLAAALNADLRTLARASAL